MSFKLVMAEDTTCLYNFNVVHYMNATARCAFHASERAARFRRCLSPGHIGIVGRPEDKPVVFFVMKTITRALRADMLGPGHLCAGREKTPETLAVRALG